MDQFGLLCLIIFAVIGAAQTICFLLGYFYEENSPNMEQVIVVPIEGEMEDLEYRIRKIRFRHLWMNKNDVHLFLLDNGMGEETRRLAHLMQRKYDWITVCPGPDFSDCMKGAYLQSR